MTYEEYLYLLYGDIFMREMSGIDAADCVMGCPHFNPIVFSQVMQQYMMTKPKHRSSFLIGTCEYDFCGGN